MSTPSGDAGATDPIAIDAPAPNAPPSTSASTSSVPSSLMSETTTFASLDLDPRLLRAVAKLRYTHPTLVQATAIPLALREGRDVVARARTGSGKTSAYCLPVVQKVLLAKESATPQDLTTPGIRALILVPTRELAQQVHKHLCDLTVYCSKTVTCATVASGGNDGRGGAGGKGKGTGGAIVPENPDILVGTPSRVVKCLEEQTIKIHPTFSSLVIDEADLILSYGYDTDVRALLAHPSLPRIFQSYLMSATMSSDVDTLKALVVRNAAILKLEEPSTTGGDSAGVVGSKLTQYFVQCPSAKQKFLLLLFTLKLRLHPFGSGKTIIFANSVDRCYRCKLFLEQFGVKSVVLNAGLPVRSRVHIVEEFNRGVFDYLIATDEGAEEDDEEVEDEEEKAEEQEDEAEENEDDSKEETEKDEKDEKKTSK
ncbi:ATP-dependent DNA/RNA helicase, partial [Quaeritorhiza haematococci]